MKAHGIREVLIIALATVVAPVAAQKIATIEVELDPAATAKVPLTIHLDEITSLPDSAFTLQEVNGSKRTDVPFQISYSGSRSLHWITKTGAKQKKKVFELVKGSPSGKAEMKASLNDGALTLQSGEIGRAHV